MKQVKQSFAAGELAPELHMRSDLNPYQKGAALLKNVVVRRTGSAAKRPGTDAISAGDITIEEVTTHFGSGKSVRLFSFYYDKDLSFALLVTYTHVRVFQASPLFQFDRDFTWSGWSDENVAAMRARQVGDTLFCTTPGKTPIRMIRQASNGSWTVAAEQVEAPPAYTVAASSITLTRAGWTNYTYSEDKDKTVYYAIYAQNEAGQRTKLLEGKGITVRKVWEAGASIRVYIVKADIPAGAVSDTWILCKKYGGAYGEIGSREITTEDRTGSGSIMLFEDDYIIPDTVIGKQTNIREGDDAGGYAITDVYQQRQVLTGNTGAPWSLWFSRLADLYTWTANRPTDDMDPFRATIPAIRASDIRHMLSGQKLLLLTTDGVYAVHSGTDGFSPRTCRIEKVNPTGVGAAMPLDTGAAVLFVADDDRTLFEMRYSFADNAHVAVDRSVLSRHLTNAARITRTAWQAYPDGLLWALLDDGTLLSFTYLPEHEVYGWTRHELKCPDLGNSVHLVDIVSTGSVLPSFSGWPLTHLESTTAVIFLAQTVEPDPKYTLLRMRQPGISQAPCIDFYKNQNMVSGDYLYLTVKAGTVWRVNQGAWTTIETDGTTTIMFSYTGNYFVEWGTPVAATVETLKPEAQDASTQAKRKRVVSVVIRTLQTGRFTVSDANQDDPLFKTEDTGAPEETTKAHDVKLPPISGWDWDGRIRIESNTPDPFQLLGVVTDFELESR